MRGRPPAEEGLCEERRMVTMAMESTALRQIRPQAGISRGAAVELVSELPSHCCRHKFGANGVALLVTLIAATVELPDAGCIG